MQIFIIKSLRIKTWHNFNLYKVYHFAIGKIKDGKKIYEKPKCLKWQKGYFNKTRLLFISGLFSSCLKILFLKFYLNCPENILKLFLIIKVNNNINCLRVFFNKYILLLNTQVLKYFFERCINSVFTV